MILGTVLESKAVKTGYGLEYRVQFDSNPEAKSMDGLAGTALSIVGGGRFAYRQGDRVVLEYRSASNYGLWFIVRKIGVGI